MDTTDAVVFTSAGYRLRHGRGGFLVNEPDGQTRDATPLEAALMAEVWRLKDAQAAIRGIAQVLRNIPITNEV